MPATAEVTFDRAQSCTVTTEPSAVPAVTSSSRPSTWQVPRSTNATASWLPAAAARRIEPLPVDVLVREADGSGLGEQQPAARHRGACGQPAPGHERERSRVHEAAARGEPAHHQLLRGTADPAGEEYVVRLPIE